MSRKTCHFSVRFPLEGNTTEKRLRIPYQHISNTVRSYLLLNRKIKSYSLFRYGSTCRVEDVPEGLNLFKLQASSISNTWSISRKRDSVWIHCTAQSGCLDSYIRWRTCKTHDKPREAVKKRYTRGSPNGGTQYSKPVLPAEREDTQRIEIS